MNIPPDDALIMREISQKAKRHKELLTREEEIKLIKAYQTPINKVLNELAIIYPDVDKKELEPPKGKLYDLAKKTVLDKTSPNFNKEAKKAQDVLVDRNLGLILDKAKVMARKTLFLSEYDLYIEGVKGIIHALDKWDNSRRNQKGQPLKLSTYATWWIRHYIQRSIHDFDRSIRIPIHVHSELDSLKKAYGEYCSTNYDKPAPTADILVLILREEPYNMKKITKERVEELGRHLWEISSIYKPLHDEDDSITILDNIAAEYVAPTDVLCEKNENKDKLTELMKCLTPLEAKFITLRYGLIDHQSRTNRDMAHLMKMKIAEVDKIEAKILDKLKRNGSINDFSL